MADQRSHNLDFRLALFHLGQCAVFSVLMLLGGCYCHSNESRWLRGALLAGRLFACSCRVVPGKERLGNEHFSSFTSTQSNRQELIMPWYSVDKENGGVIAKLEQEKREYEDLLRKRTDEVNALKKERARLQKSVRDKEAIAAAKKQ